jgi:hypothetical protein
MDVVYVIHYVFTLYWVIAISGCCNIGLLQYRVIAISGYCYIGLLHIRFLHIRLLHIGLLHIGLLHIDRSGFWLSGFWYIGFLLCRVFYIGFLTVGFLVSGYYLLPQRLYFAGRFVWWSVFNIWGLQEIWGFKNSFSYNIVCKTCKIPWGTPMPHIVGQLFGVLHEILRVFINLLDENVFQNPQIFRKIPSDFFPSNLL